ncbi:MAG: erythronate-4-phosphate dehydrogenase [Ignavibacteria bacterium]|nr:MAG: erythronate-4-phosphate dehydrogenase [Ignavibacteria bacterium]KAF0161082.1 MAG: erythronate-4-phosphate dehydrogenase [Ignavibacteria bacterium]
MNNRIKIIADDKIPFLKDVLEPFADINYLSPKEITKEVVNDADALLIRTRTKCNVELLEGSKVKFIATATIGYDHIDGAYCDSKNIKWLSAPGCNSSSVQQYIASALFTIAARKNIYLQDQTLGIVGVGNVGSKVAKLAKAIGMNVLLCDPPRQRTEGGNQFVSLNKLIEKSNIITFHVPLNRSGEDKTFHLADEKFFESFPESKIVFNSSRGEVIETSALKNALRNGSVSDLVLDVWENEPNIDLELLELAYLATPHIAGYSADGKANGTAMCVNGLADFFNLTLDKNWYPNKIPNPNNSPIIEFDCSALSEQEIITKVILDTYKIEEDDQCLRASVRTFEKQRGDYPVRREFNYYSLDLKNCTQQVLDKLFLVGFKKK